MSQLKSFRRIGTSKYKLTNTLNGSKNHSKKNLLRDTLMVILYQS